MVVIKERYTSAQFEAAFRALFQALFQDHRNISQTDILLATLAPVFEGKEDTARSILEAAGTAEVKETLTRNTQHAVEAGAFGAPFFVVRNRAGDVEPFFGSDRYGFSPPRNGHPEGLTVAAFTPCSSSWDCRSGL